MKKNLFKKLFTLFPFMCSSYTRNQNSGYAFKIT